MFRLTVFLFALLFFFLGDNRVFAVPVNRLNTESEFYRYSNKELLKFNDKKLTSKNQYFFFLGLDNDNYFRLDQKMALKKNGNDFGQTHALTFGASVKEPRKGREFGFQFDTSLYTKYLATSYDETGAPTVEQEFREISTLNFTLVDPRRHHAYFRYLLGVGLINDKKALPPFALWQQSGNSGAGGVHRMVGLNTRLKDKPSGGRRLFFNGGWSVGKFITLDQNLNLPKHLSWMNFTIESGFLARTYTEGNFLFSLLKWNIPLVRSEAVVRGKGLVDLNLQGKANYYSYDNAVGFSTTYGLQFNFARGGLMLNFTQNYANQNPSYYKYTDDDPLMSALFFLTL